jgi:hypothetical protein
MSILIIIPGADPGFFPGEIHPLKKIHHTFLHRLLKIKKTLLPYLVKSCLRGGRGGGARLFI